MVDESEGLRRKAGRPTKGAGPYAVSINLRLSPEDHEGVIEMAAAIRPPGRPAPTVQDVLRRLIRGALANPEILRRLIDEGEA